MERDRLIRLAAFDYLRRLEELHGDVLPIGPLREGFEFEGQRVPLMGPQGIFKPAALPDMPISITTTPAVANRPRPYDDEVGPDGYLRYRYRGQDPQHTDNVGLRKALSREIPLIYFHGIVPGRYIAQWPVYVMGDDPASLTFTVAMDDPQLIRPDLSVGVVDEVRRAYVTRLARQRLHQLMFRQRVLRAYLDSCSVCRLRHTELLDAAHIVPDADPGGDPVVPNGLALCKLHHAAFDRHIIGIRPDLIVDVRHDILEEVDGPMLRHGLQELQGNRLLVIPGRREDKPNPDFLAQRYERFRLAG
jgi:putative restriction endonuclease